ncbi:FGGY-family carbohydrate kinase [Nakamurella multipartita]|uniref:Carbohydrate kinase FGGY n=1 Tax=Nakamurella multipartita (strain ATCC 700099 / DSM 44233 / CIP 104796 / JCM 9543 / NBRC 105858 / Y-104) TaxID=479431 RepID=C8XH34_NAKMY|nr:FGGY family carbohydrate kinase [Nakamurella multipartita]ACV80265.1 carbohydrate kinase FGGY [Nakamurella multipartita DSM 44233]
MSTTAPLLAGLDLGSTGIKLLVVDAAGAELVVEQVPTPWQSGAEGTAELSADRLLAAVHELLRAAAARLGDLGGEPVAAIGVSGMGESGMLIDPRGTAVRPAFAWFDPRGARQVAAFPRPVREQFAGRTGLPLGSQVSVAKLALLRDEGLALRGLRWLNLPEFVAMSLGGRAVAEYSLTSRTGLLDQDSGTAWAPMLEHLGVTDTLLPPLVTAGTAVGHTDSTLPAPFAGAAITVAGHDHLVAAEATGAIPLGHYHVSMGTAEVLLRVLDAPLGYDARTRLAGRLINEVRHIVPGRHVLVAGVKTGLVLRRALQLCGIRDRAGRDGLDAAVMALPYSGSLPPGGISVTGARNDDGVLRVALQTDDATPAELFGAVLRHSNDEIARLIEAIDAEVPPATSAMLTGGWVDMAAVQRARAQVLPTFSVSARTQETAFGAARIAAGLLAPAAADTPIPGAPAPGTATPVPGRPSRRPGPPPAA